MPAHPAGPRSADLLVPHGAPPPPTSPDEANRLDPTIWPSGAVRRDDGAVGLAGLDLRTVVAEHGSPVLVLDEAHFRATAARYREAFAHDRIPGQVYYASKAFLSGAVARWVAQEGLSLDVATAGELAVALRSGFPAERILFHGNNKSAAEIGAALQAGVGRIVLDSLVEVARVAGAADRLGRVAEVLIRVTVGVEAHTHEFIATAHEDQKFGLSLAGGAAREAVGRVLQQPGLRLVGLHSHIGSQIFDANGFELAAQRMVRFLAELRAEFGIELPELNLGGGMGIAYVEGDDPLQVEDMAEQLRSIVGHECLSAGMPVPRLAVEPGRALVGPAGITVYEVGTVKPVDLGAGHRRVYVSVDGGMSDNIRTALYEAQYSAVLANRASSAPPVLARVVGKHCEAGDVVVKDVWLPGDVSPGDLLAVAATGAYCRSMASNYNYVPRPPVVSVRDGSASVVLRRETLADVLALDPWL